MKLISSTVVLAAALSVGVAASAGAQTAGTPSTAGDGQISPIHTPQSGNPAASPRAPGGTGESTVRGDKSTIRGDRAATVDQRTGTAGTR
jgi:hypothetical protein